MISNILSDMFIIRSLKSQRVVTERISHHDVRAGHYACVLLLYDSIGILLGDCICLFLPVLSWKEFFDSQF